jgi:hypothetical protein
METETRVSFFSRIRHALALFSVVAVSLASVPEVLAQCARANGVIGYYQANQYFGVAGCDGVRARDKEIREVCRVLLGASSRSSVTYSGLLTGSFHSPNDNSQCYFVNGTDASNTKTLSNAGAIGNPPNITNVNCACVPAQCRDGRDNDGDGAIDLNDFSCANALDNDEANPKSQCQDGIDNDNDGAVDLADFSCGNNRQHNDETNPKAQCQDGIDNDNDGAIDLADFSCGNNKQKNDESLPRTQCQDGLDNDNNNLIDLNDPGCTSKQDPEERGGQSPLTIALECVSNFTKSDGTRTTFFSFVNAGPEISSGFTSTFSSPAVARKNPTTLKSGACRACAQADFKGDSVAWTLEGGQIGRLTVSANASTPLCAPVEPLFNCVGFREGKLRVKAGWSNTNDFSIPYGLSASNSFSPAPSDVGQPTEYLAGLVPGAFEVVVPDSGTGGKLLKWQLGTKTVELSGTTPVCTGECIETAVGGTTAKLDEVAVKLSELSQKAAAFLESTAPKEATDSARSAARAARYSERAKTLLLEFPVIIRNCPAAPKTCSTVDRGPTIARLRGLYAEAVNSVKRITARAYFRKTGKTNRNDPLVKQAIELEKVGNAELNKLPRFATECN